MLQYFMVDVFAEQRFEGNQLAVVMPGAALNDETMQRMAREFNFSETAFITSNKAPEGAYPVRIFTPKAEVPFAGHPTLGTAFVIQREIIKKPVASVTLHLSAGPIEVSLSYGDKSPDSPEMLMMRQNAPLFGHTLSREGPARALGLGLDSIAEATPVQEVSTGLGFIIVPLASKEAMGAINLNLAAYEELIAQAGAKAVLAFWIDSGAPGGPVSMRMFAPYYGITEDPATGSGAGCLAAYLLEHKCLGADEIKVIARQGEYVGRPSVLHLRASRVGGAIAVRVGGKVVPVSRGFIEGF